MPKKKSRAKTKKQDQLKQEQRQNINIKIGELPIKKQRRRRPRKVTKEPEVPLRQLPPVVYQTLPQLTYYGKPNESGVITSEPIKATSIVEPVKAKTSIIQDIGQIGTEGPVEIIDVPTKKETLSELITPVKKPRPRPLSDFISSYDLPSMQVDPVEEGPLDLPRTIVEPVQAGPIDLPRTIVDPVQTPTTIVDPISPARSIVSEASKTAMIAEVIRETSPVKQKRTRRTKAELEEARLFAMEDKIKQQKSRAKSAPLIAKAKPIVEAFTTSEKLIEPQVASKSKKTKGSSIIPTQEMVTEFFTPKRQPFVEEKAKLFEAKLPLVEGLSSKPKKRNTSPKPKPKQKYELVEEV